MKTWLIALVGLASLAAAGCQTDPNIALLEQELRQKEDENNQLRWRLEDCQDALQALRCQKRPPSAPPASSTEPGPALTPPPSPSGEEGGPPAIQLPSQPLPEGQVPGPFKKYETPGQGGNSAPPANAPPPPDSTAPPPADSTAPPWKPSTRVAPVESSSVARITLNPALTAGYASAGSPGQEGVLVVVEPRDAAGRLLNAPADLQVVVLDPALSGSQARVARWDISAAEATARLADGPQRGIHLALPWPDRPPAHNRLHLFVRYVTSDGRKLQADDVVEVALPGDGSRGWTPARHSPAGPSSATAAPDVPPSEAPAPRTASALSDPGPPRPVWSPDRS
jgi:hypothetical protein